MAKDFDRPRRGGRSFDKRSEGDKQSFKAKFKRREGGASRDEKPDFKPEKKSFSDRGPRAERPGFAKRKSFGDGDAREKRGSFGDKKSFGDRGGFGRKKSFGDDKREGRGGFGAKKSFSDRGGFDKRKSFGNRNEDGRSRNFERRKPFSDHGDQPQRAERRFDDKKPFGKRPARNFDKPVPEGGDKFFRGKPFGKTGTRKRFDKEGDDRGERRSFVQSKISKSRGPSVKKSDQQAQKSSDGLIRLNKFISNSGVCSRREADDLIKMGLITVNGQSITEMGHKVKPGDDVRYEGKKLSAEKPVYVLLNKPKGYITTTDDPQERKTVMGLIGDAVKERIYPVGRLDRNTTGLLLLTNDGELADKLTHPSYNAKKIYKAELDKPITKADIEKIQEGVRLEEGKAIVDDLAVVSDDKKTVGIELHIGWNRIVRRIFESLGYEVVKLDRVAYAGLDKKNIGRGEWRHLKQTEVVRLKHFAQPKASPAGRGKAKSADNE